MPGIEDAQRDLEDAIDRLEKALAQRVKDGPAQLRSELDAVRRRNQALSAVVSEAADRLDGALVRVRTMIEA